LVPWQTDPKKGTKTLQTETGIKKIYLLRHGETGYSGRYLGSSDVGINAAGQEQIRAVAPPLQSIPFDTVLCSPLKRCVESCSLLGLQKKSQIIDDLREIDFGKWEKKSFDEVSRQDGERVSKWIKDSHNFTFPGGESIVDFRNRVKVAAARIEKMQETNILLISHGGIIRHLLCHFLRIDFQNYLLFDIRPGTYSTVTVYGEDGGLLTGLNYGG